VEVSTRTPAPRRLRAPERDQLSRRVPYARLDSTTLGPFAGDPHPYPRL